MNNLIKIEYAQAEQLYNAGYTIRNRSKNPPKLNRDAMGQSWDMLKRLGYFDTTLKFYVDVDELKRAAWWARETNWKA